MNLLIKEERYKYYLFFNLLRDNFALTTDQKKRLQYKTKWYGEDFVQVMIIMQIVHCKGMNTNNLLKHLA